MLDGPLWLRIGVLASVALYGVLPLIATALYSLATVWRRKPLPDGITLAWWTSTLQDPGFLWALGRSLGISVLAVILVNLLILPPLYWSHVANRRIRPVLEACALIPFVLPGVVMAAGINRFVALWTLTSRLEATPGLLLMAIVATSFPVYLWAVDGSMRAANVLALWEAASTQGAGSWRILRRVVVPSIGTGLAAGSLLMFASAMGELALARIITGSSFETLTLWQLRKLHGTDADPNGVAVASLLSLFVLFAFSFAIAIRNRGRSVQMAPAAGKG
ncbi:MAG TPA: ABC transporter permease subunit [Candidatus Cybelea sp.]|nr:ABC transporter permease subunit [Candidatus Cybelea sp.]